MDPSAWHEAARFAHWFNENSALSPDARRMARMLKLTEEIGEASQAVIGALGENPRKGGVTHTWDDVAHELCDVVFTAMIALTEIAPDAEAVFEQHLASLRARTPGPPSATA
jgi:NTP pyrophosphatase (non-canonical NTP hydrolase)